MFFSHRSLVLGMVSVVLGGYPAHGMTPESYIEALKIADQHVRRQQRLQIEARDVGISSIGRRSSWERISAHSWRAGESWYVAVLQSDRLRLQPPGVAAARPPVIGLFKYHVVSVDRHGSASIKVEELEIEGYPPIDRRVQSLIIETGTGFSQISKTYRSQSGRYEARVSADGLRSRISPLELLPLDLPRLGGAEGRVIDALPDLPKDLEGLARARGYRSDGRDGLWFEEQDFFGRASGFFWRSGDPWPAYVQSAYGVSVLLKSGGFHR